MVGALGYGQQDVESPLDTSPEVRLRRFAVTPPVTIRSGSNGATNVNDTAVAVSPNGMYIAFAEGGSVGGLWIQELDREQARAIQGTEGAWSPLWSPDSQFIAFAAGGELRRVSVEGGPVVRIADLPDATHFHGGSWSPDGEVIVFSSGPSSLYSLFYEVPAL